MVEKFIAVTTCHNDATTIHFFSMKTLNLQWQKTVEGDMRDNFVYDQGMFLRYVVKQRESEECGIIEMYDVTCDQCFRKMRATVNEGYEGLKQRVGFNSKFMALAESNDVLEYIYIYRLNIYDLEAVKNKKSCDNLLVFTLEESWDSLVMDESRILCHSFKEMNMLMHCKYN